MLAVMQQVDLGVLDIDHDIGNYQPFPVRNPDFPNVVITTRMLMRLGAGLAHPGFGEVTDELFATYDRSVIVQLHPLIENVMAPSSPAYRDTIWLAGAPGSINMNSNFGMVLLACLVEQLTGLHYQRRADRCARGPGQQAQQDHPPMAAGTIAMNSCRRHRPWLPLRVAAPDLANGNPAVSSRFAS
jgi:hypothetical protein